MDKFYTLYPKQIVSIWQQYIKTTIKDILIEPSAGDGRFLELVPFTKAYDIEPNIEEDVEQHVSIIKQDFLTTTDQNAHYLGNPPFGIIGNLAKQFITHCCNNKAKSISFILPRSFKKYSMQKVFPLNYHLIYQCDYDQFELPDKTKKMIPCVFQIWIYKDYQRIVPIQKYINPYFEYISISQVSNATHNIQRVGSKAGLLQRGINVSHTSHYFIKFNDNVNVYEFTQQYNQLQFQFNNSTGPKSLSKPELNEYLDQLDESKILLQNYYEYYDESLVQQFDDNHMKDYYIQSKSFTERTQQLIDIFQKYITQEQSQQILQDQSFINLIIQPQSKASIRGYKLNQMVKELCQTQKDWKVSVEQKIQGLDEIVDTVVQYNNKTIYLYNQIDLFNGGEQLNRCSKYLNLNRNDIILVIIDKPKTQSKALDYLKQGIQSNKIVFYNGLLQLLQQKLQ